MGKITTENIFVGSADIYFNGHYLGTTIGGVDISWEPKYVDVYDDQLGDAIKVVLEKENFRVKTTLAEATYDKISTFFDAGPLDLNNPDFAFHHLWLDYIGFLWGQFETAGNTWEQVMTGLRRFIKGNKVVRGASNMTIVGYAPNGLYRIYTFIFAGVYGPSNLNLNRDRPTVIPVEFKLLPDPTLPGMEYGFIEDNTTGVGGAIPNPPPDNPPPPKLYLKAVQSFVNPSGNLKRLKIVGSTPTPPSAPTGLIANPSDVTVTLYWNQNPESNITSYKIYQFITNTWTLIKTVAYPAHTTIITGLSPGTHYSFRVSAVNNVPLESAFSIVAATTDTPSNVVVLPIGSGPGQFDPTGFDDISDQLMAWLNDRSNYPFGTSPTDMVKVIFPATQSNGSPAIYRIEGGINGAVRTTQNNVTWDGGGSRVNFGTDGAQFIQKTKVPFIKKAEPTTNPRGRRGTDGNTTAVPGWKNNISYPNLAIVANGSNRFKSLKPNNLNHPTSDTAWWQNIGPDGVFVATNANFITLGVVPGVDTIQLRPKGEVPSTYVERTIIAVNVGGNPHAIDYSGPSIGAAGPMEYIINPDGEWTTFYSPTNTIVNTFDSTTVTAYERAEKNCFDLNRNRTMFQFNRCIHLRIKGIQFTGSNDIIWRGPDTYDPNNPTVPKVGYDPDYEGQDAIKWMGCTDCEIGDFTIERFWGNGYESQPFALSGGGIQATIGIWAHDGRMTIFGRQSMSLTYGGHFIHERVYCGESSRTLVDAEPTNTTIDPALDGTVDGIYFVNCTIGWHKLGHLSMHEGVINVMVKSCKGNAIGLAGVAVIGNCVFEDNVDSGIGSSPSRYDFQRGNLPESGKNIVIRNNMNQPVATSGAQFHDTDKWDPNYYVDPKKPATIGYNDNQIVNYLGGRYKSRYDRNQETPVAHPPATSTGWIYFGVDAGCSNYVVSGNDFGGKPQFIDDFTDRSVVPNVPAPWSGTFNPTGFYPMVIPHHALRDLTLPGGTTFKIQKNASIHPSGTLSKVKIPGSAVLVKKTIPASIHPAGGFSKVKIPATAGSITAKAYKGGIGVKFTPPSGTFDYYEVRLYGMVSGVPTAPPTPTADVSYFPAAALVTSGATWAHFSGASNIDSSATWINTLFDRAHGGFADTYVARVRGYNSSTNTFGAFSGYSNQVVSTETINDNGLYIAGAQLPDGTPIGIPTGTALTVYTGNYKLSGTYNNMWFQGAPDIVGTTTCNNCLFQPIGAVDRSGNGNSGPMVHNPSSFIATFNHCEFDGRGPGLYGNAIDYTNYVVNNSIIHSTSAFGLYGGGNGNITAFQTMIFDVCSWALARETSSFSHRDCFDLNGTAGGPINIQRCVLDLHSTQNRIIFLQSGKAGAAVSGIQQWKGNWLSGGGGSMMAASAHAGDFLNNGTYQIWDNNPKRWPYGFWLDGPNGGSPSNPNIMQNDTSNGSTPIFNFGSPDTNVWWEPGFPKPIGM